MGKIKHGMAGTKVYASWNCMRNRCTNPNYSDYKNYGAKGIGVCDEWLVFMNFYKDMGDRPEGMTLDRVDNTKGYSKENCRWASYTEQSINRGVHKNNKLGVKGVYMHKQSGKYNAYIYVSRKSIHLGSFTNLGDAIKARKDAELKYWGK